MLNAKSNKIEDRDFNTIFSCKWHFRNCIITNVECDRKNLDKLVIALNVYKKGKASITWHELMTVKESNEVTIPFQ